MVCKMFADFCWNGLQEKPAESYSWFLMILEDFSRQNDSNITNSSFETAREKNTWKKSHDWKTCLNVFDGFWTCVVFDNNWPNRFVRWEMGNDVCRLQQRCRPKVAGVWWKSWTFSKETHGEMSPSDLFAKFVHGKINFGPERPVTSSSEKPAPNKRDWSSVEKISKLPKDPTFPKPPDFLLRETTRIPRPSASHPDAIPLEMAPAMEKTLKVEERSAGLWWFRRVSSDLIRISWY